MATITSRSARVGVLGAVLALAALAAGGAAAAAPVPVEGSTVWVGSKVGYGGTGLYAVYLEEPSDPENPGEPDYWSYCLENRVTARTDATGVLGESTDFLGENLFADPGVPEKVLWVLAHSYPALSLEDFAAAVGIPAISENDAIEATQYAIWRYTDLGFDAAWPWETEDSEAAYLYLQAGANASAGLTRADFESTVDIVGPTSAQKAGTLVGPFVLSTDQPRATIAVDPSLSVVDAAGSPIDTTDVIDGDSFFLDVRGSTAAGSATITASVLGSSATGLIISVPVTEGGTPTDQEHAQTQILVAPSTTTTDATAAVEWTAAPQLAATGSAPDGRWVAAAAGLLAAIGLGILMRRRAAS